MEHDFRYDMERLATLAYDQVERFPDLVERVKVVPEATAFIFERLAKTRWTPFSLRRTICSTCACGPMRCTDFGLVSTGRI